jgi:hypothetical protein
MHSHRQSHVEKRRVSHITKGYAKGGAVKGDKSIGKQALTLHKHEHEALDAEGEGAKHRMDRPKRAKGGKVKGKSNAKTVINVITGHPGGGAAPPPMAPPGIGGAAMPPPAPPPMIAKPPMPGAGPGMPPPSMPPMRARGGKVQTPTGTGVAKNTRDSEKNHGSPVFNASMRDGTQISHAPGKADSKDIGRREVVSFASGGKVKTFSCRAKGGRIESPKGVAKATELPGGSGGGEARLVKEARAKRDYHKA